MSIRFTCSKCGNVSVLKDSMAGKRIKCSECGKVGAVAGPPLLMPEEDDDRDDDAGESRSMMRFVAIAGFFVLIVIGVLGIMYWRWYLERPKPAEPPPQAKAPEPAPVADPNKGKEEELLKRAAEAISRNDFPLAIRLADDAVALNPKSTQALYVRAEALRGNKQYDRALADLTEVLKLDGKAGLAYVGRAKVYVDMSGPAAGDSKDLLKLLESVDSAEQLKRLSANLDRAVSDTAMAEKLGIAKAQASLVVAPLARLKAEALLSRCRQVKTQANSFKDLPLLSDDLLGAIVAMDGEIDKKANAFLMASYQLNPKDPVLYEDWALLNLIFKHYDEALKMTADGLKLAPKSGNLHFLQGAAYSQMGNRQQAEASYQRAVKLNPNLASDRGEFYK